MICKNYEMIKNDNNSRKSNHKYDFTKTTQQKAA